MAWPPEVREVNLRSSLDGVQQPALFWQPPPGPPRDAGPVPLLVALHSWSTDYANDMDEPLAHLCMARGWCFIHPQFRGPNRNPEAGGSDLVIQDIADAVAFACCSAAVDPERIYATGVSGGGYACLLAAGRLPAIWAGVSAWVPISDLRAWYYECRARGLDYASDIEAVCGGAPGQSPAVDAEYVRRSPIHYLNRARGVALDINTGIHDGHKGSVPVSHALRAFNAVAKPADRLGGSTIGRLTAEPEVPEGLRFASTDPDYGDRKVLLRRQSDKARVTIFEGEHEMLHEAAVNWLAGQRRRPATRGERT
jgi:acetyl esterase/lipase